MTYLQRFIVALLLTTCTNMLLGCGGAGTPQNQPVNAENDLPVVPPDWPLPELSKKVVPPPIAQKKIPLPDPVPEPAPDPEQDLGELQDKITVGKAVKAREQALLRQEEVITGNKAKQLQYEKNLEFSKKERAKFSADLDAFETATTEYKSLKELAFAEKLKTEAALTKWYTGTIREYPGTSGAKEAQRRLNGGKPKMIPVPPVPIAPSAPGHLKKPHYEIEPAIPEVPTLDELKQLRLVAELARKAREREIARKAQEEADAAAEVARNIADAAAEAARKLAEEYDVNGLVLMRKTLKGLVGEVAGEITGIVVNRRAQTFQYVKVTFSLFDDSGARVGSAFAIIDNLGPGQSWSFRAITLNNRWKSYGIAELKGF